MTATPDSAARPDIEQRPSLLPFNPADLVAMRVLPSEFARMVGVTKQSVSQWIKQGKVTLGPDGRLDPHKAAREVIQRTDPARLRARVFKAAMEGNDELRARVRDLERQLAEERAAFERRAEHIVYATRNQCADTLACQLAALEEAILGAFDQLALAHATGELSDRLDALVSSIFYPDCGASADAADAADESPDETAEAPKEPL